MLPDVESIIQTRLLLDDYLTEHCEEKVHEYHELPFQHQTDGHIVCGSMDLVWEIHEGCVLIAFKTIPCAVDTITTPANPHYADHYGAQFTYYRVALVKRGQKVLQCYVFYPVVGLLVPITV